MSASQIQVCETAVLQLAETLAQYDAATDAMIAQWPDLECYHEASALVEAVRMHCAGLPQLRVQWVELLIAHAELVHHLWREQYAHGAGGSEGVAAVREHHADCIAALRARCRRLLAR